jgi:hypothetical protein
MMVTYPLYFLEGTPVRPEEHLLKNLKTYIKKY